MPLTLWHSGPLSGSCLHVAHRCVSRCLLHEEVSAIRSASSSVDALPSGVDEAGEVRIRTWRAFPHANQSLLGRF